MSLDEVTTHFNNAQWEAEYGTDRLKLIKEEEDKLRHDQEDIFPKTEPWTVWLHRVNSRGVLIRFSYIEEAYSYSLAALYNDSLDASITKSLDRLSYSNEIENIGQTDSLQVAMFKGVKVPEDLLNFSKEGFYVLKPTQALKLGPNKLFDHTNNNPIIEVPLTEADLEHWTECLSAEVKTLAGTVKYRI